MFYHAQVPDSTGKTTAIYVRSSTRTRTTESQLEACRRVADKLCFDVIHEFVDEAISGTSSTTSRPGTRELMASLHSLDVLLVYRLDRLSRSAVELTDLLRKLAASEVQVWSVADFQIPARIVTDQIADIAAFAETERSAIRQRMGDGIRRAAETGKWIGGPVPFGYDLDANGALTPSVRVVAGMTEAELARSVFERISAGLSTIKEARRLNELEVFPGRRYSHKTITMRRKNWLPSRINAMVRNSVYKGIHVFDHSIGPIERQVSALVSPSLWQAAQDGHRDRRLLQRRTEHVSVHWGGWRESVNDVSYREVEVKTALNEVRGMPFEWSLNPFLGCAHACRYCFSRAYHARYRERNV